LPSRQKMEGKVGPGTHVGAIALRERLALTLTPTVIWKKPKDKPRGKEDDLKRTKTSGSKGCRPVVGRGGEGGEKTRHQTSPVFH